MSFRPVFSQATPLAATLLAGGVALYPRRTAFAEEPRDQRKPIYDDLSDVVSPVAAPVDTPKEPTLPVELPTKSAAPAPASSAPTPTDILTAQVRQARVFLYKNSLAAETCFNDILARALNVENAFTNTVAALAPSPESGERLLPGGAYVVVAAMAGSIVARNRGILLRTASPLAFGTVAAWTLLPVTMRNVSDLVWEYEKQVPALAEQHLALRNNAQHIWSTGLAHSAMTRAMMEEKIGDVRKKLEEVVSKGH
ncbi:putative mitochondrial protein [Aspergillus taichungensis]|uniref:MICOS complex subunit n=1 Tax=Aspergillus taichungensis TaxID=482145 RepID=A0A2J5HJP8_9EURO|nr:putative mitochondrial protein [Aspergillus taichungensis]